MSAIFGVISSKINNKKAMESLGLLSNRGKFEAVENSENTFLAHRQVDLQADKQLHTFNQFTITFNGRIYNKQLLKKQLVNKGYTFTSDCDSEIVIKLFDQYGTDCFDRLDGMFAFVIWDNQTKQLFACRDKLAIKPFFYFVQKGEYVFASEIKAILNYKNINSVTTATVQEILALGPSRVQGSGIYPNVYELKGGHYAVFKNKKLTIKKYWQLKSKVHEDGFEKTVETVNGLLTKAITNTLQGEQQLSVLLSGGLDSTIITLISNQIKDNLKTYSVDYVDNNKYFKSNEFQISSDNKYIQLVKERYGIDNKTVYLTNQHLLDSLESALIARDYPGMVDVDGSLYQFSKIIKNDGFDIILSGEGADEIFGGYPWFYKEKFDNGFPWIRNVEYRHSLLNENYKQKLDLKNYLQEKFDESVAEVPLDNYESEVDKQHKILTYLNINWFMQTLIERKDRMTMASALEARLPFMDIKLVEYLYNVPWEMKFYNNMEKGLLREATKGIVPPEILHRKKSPYPKTFNPIFYKGVRALLISALNQESSILHELFNSNKLQQLISDEKDLPVPWFGQLMTKPQLLAYLYQIHLWFEKYNLTLM